ncbi:hypothetical protein IF1G_06170 [Cordyceps javanica]|uniref:Uncharacterized protein n=1 Tax=Cordyceps javanica TaxID=43265 RepID=A0A545V0G1_9HYPO|nr:hypothetical protein IF1G_06170 [Cordyceps javanica]
MTARHFTSCARSAPPRPFPSSGGEVVVGVTPNAHAAPLHGRSSDRTTTANSVIRIQSQASPDTPEQVECCPVYGYSWPSPQPPGQVSRPRKVRLSCTFSAR